MKKLLQFIFLFFMVFFLENSFIPMLNLPVPTLSMLFTMMTGIYFGGVKGALCGLLLGLTSDIIFSYPVGIEALKLFIIGALAGEFQDICERKRIFFLVTVFIATILYFFIGYLTVSFFSYEINLSDYSNLTYIWIIILNLLLSIPMDLLFYKLFAEKSLSFGN